ncbi:MAG: hypothetical protein ACK5Z5_07045 [Neisseriaceae bacterium]
MEISNISLCRHNYATTSKLISNNDLSNSDINLDEPLNGKMLRQNNVIKNIASPESITKFIGKFNK